MKLRKLASSLIPCVAIALLMLLANSAEACPTCSEALAENDPQSASVVSGYFYSILFMMGTPFAILGTLVGMAFFSIRKAKHEEAIEENELNADILRAPKSIK